METTVNLNLEPVVKTKIEQKSTLGLEFNAKSVASENHPENNEDRFFYNGTTFGVFDGMTYEGDGDVASNISCESVKKSLSNVSPKISVFDAQLALEDAFYQANDEVLSEVEKRRKGMGSTGTFGVICHDQTTDSYQAVICNVGDSRAYRFRDGKSESITLDNGILQIRYQKLARIYQDKFSNLTNLDNSSFEEKELFKGRNQIYKFFGSKNLAKPDFYTVDLKAGDRLLLCTDGVHDNLTDQEISAILSENNNSDDAVKKLIKESKERSFDPENIRSKDDDVTAILISIKSAKIEDIATSKNLNQLISTVKNLGGLQGSDGYFYSSDELIELINGVTNGEITSDHLTRSGDLRNTVSKLIK